MQKGKHQGGQTQGYSHRNYSAYPGNPDTTRQYTREVTAFHASGTPGGGPGMRGMHHTQPTQPPTPPTSQDIKQPPTHLPPQSHPMPPQSGGQMMPYTMTGAGRSNSQQSPFFSTQRGPSTVQRMAPHPRTPVIMSNNPQSFIHQPTVQPVYPSSLVSPVPGQSMFVTPQLNQSFQIQAQPRHQGGFYPPQQFVIPAHHIFPSSYPQMFYSPQIPQMSRPGGPAPNSQAAAPHPQQAGMTMITTATSTMVSPPSAVEVPKQPRRKVLKIINPANGRDILDDILMNNNTPPKTGDSSARQTPQPNSEQKTDQGVAAEFATRVAIAARSDQAGSPNSPALQQQPSSRASNYSENESQASPDMQGMSAPSVSPSKLDISAENIQNEGQIVENNMTYDANQQAPMVRPGWSQMMTQVELMPVPIHSSLIMPEELMRGGAPPAQPPREYQSMHTPWVPEASAVPVSVIISKEPSAPPIESVRPGPERITPVVSALAHAPTVDIHPRHQRDQFPALVKGHQQPSPVKRKQRSEVPQEQVEVKSKEPSSQPQPQSQSQQQQQQQQQQQPQQPQQQPVPQPQKTVAQQKQRQATPTVESKKQSTSPPQDSDEYVQSIQTRNSDAKTIPIKVSEADSSETKVKPNDNLTNKEYNNVETRNLNEEVIQDNNNRNKSEVVKSEVVLPAQNTSLPRSEEGCKYQGVSGDSAQGTQKVAQADEGAGGEAQTATQPAANASNSGESKWTNKANGEIAAAAAAAAAAATTTATAATTTATATAAPEPQPEKAPPVPDSAPESKSKSNGEAVVDDAKQNNQKQKAGSKRQAQSKMKLEKEAYNAEQSEPLANEVAPAQAPAVPEAKTPPPPTPVNTGHSEEAQPQEETAADEEKEKEKDLIVAAKNEENNKQTASLKTNESTPSPVIESVKKLVVKHNYKKDQWSPSNPSGKKKYDRDFIMALMKDPQSLRRPENLPDLDVLKDKQRPSDRNFSNSMYRDINDYVTPVFSNKNSIQRSSQILQKKGSQTSKPKVTKPPVIHMSLLQDVKLHETENAWKPSRNTLQNNLTEEEIKTEELYKRVRGVLNKLTPEKFSTLVDQLKVLPIDNHTRLKGVIDLVFEKAVDEPSFSVAYAEMCKTIQDIEVPTDMCDADGKPIKTSFKKILIGRCQTEFEKDTTAEMKRREEKLKEIEQEADPEKKKFLQLVYEEEERRVRMKSVGNSRFIGELYKLKMLTCNIMHQCIARLLHEGDEESLECLCKLLTTVGRGFESKAIADSKALAESKGSAGKAGSKDKKNDSLQELNNYFKKLGDIVKNKGSKKISSRVRFMIQDLIDLRSNNWIPRRDDSNPKTIDQIQKEAERETLEMNLALNSAQDNRNKRQDSRNSVDNRKRGGGVDSSGWTTVPQNRGRYVIEPAKLKLDQSDVEVKPTVSLGNLNQFAVWGQGLGGGKLDTKKMNQLSGNNMFAVLNDKISQPNSRNSSLKGSSISDKERGFSSYKSNYDDEGRSSRSGSQQGPESRSSSRDSVSSKHDDRRYINSSSKGQTPNKSSNTVNNPFGEVDLHVIESEAKLILEEYNSDPSFDETEFSVKKILCKCTPQDFVTCICRSAMEMSGSKPKRSVGKLMSHFIKNNIISKRQFLESLSKELEIADDLAIDMPFIWVYFAEILVDIIAEENLFFRDLAEFLKPRRGTREAVKLLTSLFGLLLKEKSEKWVEERWGVSQVKLSDLIGKENVDGFIEKNKLEFLLKEIDLNSVKMNTIKKELCNMISDKTSCDTVMEWINENVSPDKRSTPEFARILITVLLETSVIQNQSSYKFEPDCFSNYEQLILKYIDHSEELELPCLYAVQAFIHKLVYPQGLVSAVCQHLWEHELIACETFISWLETKNPVEKEGHAVCAKSLRPLLTVLNETLTDDES